MGACLQHLAGSKGSSESSRLLPQKPEGKVWWRKQSKDVHLLDVQIDAGSGGVEVQRQPSSQQNTAIRGLRMQLQQAIASCRDEETLERALHSLQTAPVRRQVSLSSPPLLSKPMRANTLVHALEELHGTAPPQIGLDIGGTLAKLAVMNPVGTDHTIGVEKFESHKKHAELAFHFHFQMEEYRLRFLSGDTAKLGSYLEEATGDTARGAPTPSSPSTKIVVSGGGAHKFAQSMKKTSNIEMVPFQEMESLVAGLDFLFKYGPEDEVFTLGDEGETLHFDIIDIQDRLPCLLVNMGSGVSILRVEGPAEGQEGDGRYIYQRVGGTACGGKTFLGLMKRLTSATTFEEMVSMASRGDAGRINTLVGDIYGEDGCGALGLPPQVTAAYFGKWPPPPDADPKQVEVDSAAALMMMVVQESVVLARALSLLLSAQVGTDFKPLVFFVGGFLAKNSAAQQIITRSFKNLTLGPALFLKHADFLGALGCLKKSLEKELDKREEELQKAAVAVD